MTALDDLMQHVVLASIGIVEEIEVVFELLEVEDRFFGCLLPDRERLAPYDLILEPF